MSPAASAAWRSARLPACKSGNTPRCPRSAPSSTPPRSPASPPAPSWRASSTSPIRSIVVGAGIVAGGPYGCAESFRADRCRDLARHSSTVEGMNGCMLDAMRAWGIPDVKLLRRARPQAGQVRPHRSDRRAARDRVYLFTGTKDQIVTADHRHRGGRALRALGVPDAQVKLRVRRRRRPRLRHRGQGHRADDGASPTSPIATTTRPETCSAHIYGTAAAAERAQPAGDFVVFDQRAFVRDLHRPRPRRRGLRLRAARLPRPGLPRPHRVPRLRPAARQGRRCLRERQRLCQVGRHQSPDRCCSRR